jgi:hypothetical protein
VRDGVIRLFACTRNSCVETKDSLWPDQLSSRRAAYEPD